MAAAFPPFLITRYSIDIHTFGHELVCPHVARSILANNNVFAAVQCTDLRSAFDRDAIHRNFDNRRIYIRISVLPFKDYRLARFPILNIAECYCFFRSIYDDGINS